MKPSSLQEDRILRASETLFFRFGLMRVTTEQIAAEAGVSKRTIYSLFPTKISIAIRSFVRAAREIDTCLARLDPQDASEFEDCLRQFLTAVALGTGRFSAPLIADLIKADPRLGQRLLKARRSFLSHRLRDILVKGLENGSVRKGINLDATVMVTLMALDCLLHPEARQALRLRVPDPESVADVLLKGIRPRS